MQLADMITEARRMFGQTNPSNSHVSDQELTSWGNEALREMISEMEEDPYQEATATTVENTATYDLSSRIVFLKRVSLEGEDGVEREIPTISLAEMGSQMGSGWRSDDAGVPRIAYKSASNQLGLHPKPNAANAGKTLRILYSRYQNDLSDTTDTPTMNLVAHDAIPYFMAAKAFLKIREWEAAKAHMAFYTDKKKRHKLTIQKFSNDFQGWRWGSDA